MGWDSNPRWRCRHAGFQDRCLKPLGHPSNILMIIIFLLIDGNRKVARTQPRHAVGLRDRSDGAGTERQEGEHEPPAALLGSDAPSHSAAPTSAAARPPTRKPA